MSMTSDDEDVTTREARRQLGPGQGTYWHAFDSDCYLGYYRGNSARVWTVRLYKGKRQREGRLAFADDFEDADGIRVMNYEQARAAARNWCAAQITKKARQPIDDRPFMTAGPACNRD